MSNYQLSTNNPQLPEGYKQTEVGIIPKDWKVLAIGETVTLINGRAFKPSDWKTHGLPIIRIQNLNDPEAAYNYYEGTIEQRYYVNYGDILFAWSGTKESSFGARMWSGKKAILNQHIFRVIPDEEKITSQYILLALKRFQEDIEKKSHGFKTSFVHVRKSDLEKTSLAVPPLPEQRTIAQALSDVDALIAALDKLIAKKGHIKTATMQQLLTGKKRLPGFGEGKGYEKTDIGVIPEDWRCLKFIEAVRFYIDYRGRTPRKLGMSWGGGNILALSANNVLMGKIDPEKESYVGSEELYQKWMVQGECEIGDILLTMEAPLGNVAQIPNSNKYILSQRVVLIKTENDINKYFFAHYLRGIFFQRQLLLNATGSTAQGIQRKKLDKIFIYLPAKLEEQCAIAQVLSDIDTEISALEKRRAKTQAIKQGMMQELLTGRTRLSCDKT